MYHKRLSNDSHGTSEQLQRPAHVRHVCNELFSLRTGTWVEVESPQLTMVGLKVFRPYSGGKARCTESKPCFNFLSFPEPAAYGV